MLSDVIEDLRQRVRGMDADEDFFLDLRTHRSSTMTDVDAELSWVRARRAHYERAIEILEAAK